MRVALSLCLALATAPLAAHADPTDPRVALLERDAAHARVWYVGFTAAYAVSAVAQTTFALLIADDGLRVDAAVGAGSSWLAVGGMVISPIPDVWRAAADARGGASLDAAIARAAAAEGSARAWYNHAACVAVAVGAGLILWLGYDRPISGAINFAENLVVGELNLLTIPTRALRWRDRPVATWHLAPTLQGVQLVGTW